MLSVYERRMLALFVFVVAVFAFLAYRAELSDMHAREQARASCVMRAANVERLNTFYRGMIEIEQHNPYRATSPETVAARIKLFRGAILTVPDCSTL